MADSSEEEGHKSPPSSPTATGYNNISERYQRNVSDQIKMFKNAVKVSDNPAGNQKKKNSLVPKDKFFKLSFPAGIGLQEKYDWSNKYSPKYQQEMTIPNKQHWWFQHVYVLRCHNHLIQKLLDGKIGRIQFVSADIPPKKKNRKLKEYICKGYPPSLSEEDLINQLGVDNIHSFKRIHYNRRKTSSVKLVWKSDHPPPNKVPLLSSHDVSITIQEMLHSNPTCFNCQQTGHMAAGCKNAAVCPLCGGGHSLQKCPVKENGRQNKKRSDSEMIQVKIKCFRCNKEGVNAWSCNCRQNTNMELQSSSMTVQAKQSVECFANDLQNNNFTKELDAVIQVCEENKSDIMKLNSQIGSLQDSVNQITSAIATLGKEFGKLVQQSAAAEAQKLDNFNAKLSQVVHEIGNNVANEMETIRNMVHDQSCNTKSLLHHLEKMSGKKVSNQPKLALQENCASQQPSPATKQAGSRTKRANKKQQ